MNVASILALVRCLDRGLRIRLLLLALFMLVVSALEVISTGAMFPLIAALVDSQEFGRNAVLLRLREFVNPPTYEFFIVVLVGVFLCIILVKACVVLWGYRVQFRLIYDIQRHLSSRVLRIYALEPFAAHMRRNPADLIKNIQTEIPALANGVITPAIQALSELVIAVAIVALLLLVSPVLTTLLCVTLLFTFVLLYRFARHSNDRFGAQRSIAVSEMFRTANTLLSGLKELRVLDRANNLLGLYDRAAERYGVANAYIMLLAQIPRLAFESIAFATFATVIVYAMATTGEIKTTLPLVALYAAAAYRLMPSFNRIAIAALQLRFYRRAVDTVFQALASEASAGIPAEATAFDQVVFDREIEISKLSYVYPGTGERILDGLSLTIPACSTIGIVGPSGAGKSTLVDILLGVLDGYEGRISVDGRLLDGSVTKAWLRLVGYVPQSIYLSDDTLKRNIAFGEIDTQIDHRAVVAACEIAQLQELVASLPEGLDTVVGERGVRLSGGQRQRVGIARALYRDPKVLIMDEATSALDGLTEHEIARQIELLSGKKTILIIAHRLSTIRKCSLLYVIENGTVTASGSYDELAGRSDYFSKLQALIR